MPDAPTGFLQHQFNEFKEKESEEKMVDILRKVVGDSVPTFI